MVPGILKLVGYLGLFFWLAILGGVVIVLIGGPMGGSSPEDLEYDRIALMCGIVLSVIGLSLNVGVISGKVWAYYGLIVGLGLVAALAILYGLVSESWRAAVWTGLIGGLAILLQRLLHRDAARDYFHLTGKQRNLLAAPAWWCIAMGLCGLALSYWPQPTALLGVWVPEWLGAITNLSYGVTQIVLGWGLLTRRKWIWSMTIVLGLVSLVHSAALGWDTNPGGMLETEKALTRATVVQCALLGLIWTAWTLRRIWLDERKVCRAFTPLASGAR